MGTVVVALLLALQSPAVLGQETDTWESRLHFHGYGEVHYNNPELGTMDQTAPSRADVHRFVLGWTYDFTPAIRLDAELDYEHAARELELEYAHLDFDVLPALTLRVGSLLMPVGPLNEFHEPPLYYSVERPYVQNYVIPTTWQENGLGLVGRTGAGAIGYRAYAVTGLDATAFSTLGGIRGGRTGSSEALAEDLAAVGRIEVAGTTGLTFGASGYFGGADHDAAGLGDVTVGIAAADARLRRSGFDLRGVYARVFVNGADSVSAVTGEGVGEVIQGFYAEAAYDFLRRDLSLERRRSLFFFVRFERFDTNEEMPDGVPRDPAADRRVVTTGAAFMPIEKISLKADFEHWKDSAEDKVNRFNLGAAFLF